ncbi:MAG: hypothetical protein M3R70_00645 [Actinomycetota bacterium]|nr:hypothetical protein [Actinomycetota bacterium]
MIPVRATEADNSWDGLSEGKEHDLIYARAKNALVVLAVLGAAAMAGGFFHRIAGFFW